MGFGVFFFFFVEKRDKNFALHFSNQQVIISEMADQSLIWWILVCYSRIDPKVP